MQTTSDVNVVQGVCLRPQSGLYQLYFFFPVRQVGWVRSRRIIPLMVPAQMPHIHSITLCFDAAEPSDGAMWLDFVPDGPPRYPPIYVHGDSIPHALRFWVPAKAYRPTVRKIDPSHLFIHRKRCTRTVDATVSDTRPRIICNCTPNPEPPSPCRSERSVVSIAASVPHLERLTLDGITRSLVHAPELLAAYPFVPLVVGDEDIESHPILGSNLSLPSLLRIPTLRRLQLSETHLGDPLWGTTPSSPDLQVLDLGACGHQTPEFNMMCTERIINNLARFSSIRELFINTPLQDERFKDPFSTPLRSLDHIHLMPLLPVDRVVETLFTLSGSPIHTISVECYEEEALEMCYALEDFLTVRFQQPDTAFYQQLTAVNLQFVVLDPSSPMIGHNESLGRVRRLCDAMGLSGETPPLTTEPSGAEQLAESRFVRKAWWNAGQDTSMETQ